MIRVVSDTRSGFPAIRYEVTASDKELDLNEKRFGPVTVEEDPRSFVEPFFAELDSFSLEDSEAAAEAEERIAASGTNLANDLLPPDLQALLYDLSKRKQVVTLLIQSKEDWIPWELLKLKQGPFLCEAFALSRWQGEVGFRGRLHLPLRSMAFLSPPDAKLEAAPGEHASLDALLQRTRRKLHEIEATYNSVVSELAKGEFDGWHFAGHGLNEGEESNFWTIELAHGSELRPKDLSGKASGFGRARPLVFFNGCFTGQVGKSLSRAGGWAAQWMELGAGAFVGTSWAIQDDSAAAFASAFYESFLKGASLPEAVREARLAIRKQFPGDPTWLTYVAYGHPCARCAPRPIKLGRFLVATLVAILLVLLSVGVLRGWQHRRFVEHNDQAIEMWKNGDWLGAEKGFQRALRIKNVAHAQASLGQVYSEQNRWPEALESFDQAIALEPKVPSYHFSRGSVLLHVRRTDEAVEEFHQALELDPQYVEAYNNLGRAYLELGYFEEARTQLEAVTALVADGRSLPGDTMGVVHKNLAWAYLELGSQADAVHQAQLALRQLDVGNVDARRQATVLLARSYADSGQAQDACTTLRQQFRALDLALISPQVPQARGLATQLNCPLEGGE